MHASIAHSAKQTAGTHPCSDREAHEAAVLVLHVVVPQSSGRGPVAAEEDDLERAGLRGTKNRRKSQTEHTPREERAQTRS